MQIILLNMIFNFLIFLLFSIIIILSTIGYGLAFSNKILGNSKYINLPLKGILGIFFLYLLSSLTHIILPHNFTHNLVVLSIGLILFFKLFKKEKTNKKQFNHILFFFVCLFLGFLISKTNEDFPYYHLPNSLQFASHKLEIGLGNLNHGFKHISSLFLINSLFYLPIVEIYLFNITNFMLQIFFFSTLTVILLRNYNNNFTYIIVLTILVTYITKFYRLSEYGADYFGQFLVILSFVIASFSFTNKKLSLVDKKELFSISIYLVIFAITIKFLYSIYLLIPLFIFFYMCKSSEIFKFIFDKKFLILSSITLISVFFFNFVATGCFLYPMIVTCLTETVDWSISKDTINYLNSYYKAWSKAGIGTGYGVEDPDAYISSFSWIKNWFENYFFTKVSDYILVIVFVSLILFFTFYKDLKKKNYLNINIKILYISYLSIIIVFCLWFFNFPSLRYAGYSVVFLIIVVPLCIFFSKRIDFNNYKVKKKFKILIVISLIIFNFKNIQRLNHEINLKSYEHHNFFNFPFYWVDNVEYETFTVNAKSFNEVTNNKSCWNVPSTCIKNRNYLDIQKKGNYFFYKKK